MRKLTTLFFSLWLAAAAMAQDPRNAAEARASSVRVRQTIERAIRPQQYALTVVNNASESGVIAPGCAAVIRLTGATWAVESTQTTVNPLPTTLAGLTVTIDGKPAQIRHVSPDSAAIIAPHVDIAANWYLPAWFPVTVNSPFGTFAGWAAYSHIAPGIYEQVTNGQPHAQGIYRKSKNDVQAIAGAIPAGVTAGLVGTGFLNADNVTVWMVDDADKVYSARATATPFYGFAWMETLVFDVPAGAQGRLMIIFEARKGRVTRYSNTVWLTIE